MFEITVKISVATNNKFSHTEIRVQDMSSKQAYIVSFVSNRRPAVTNYQKKLDTFDEVRCLDPMMITLYSNINKSLDQFVDEMNKDAKSCCGFDIVFHNCAYAGNYTLNYFFPILDNLQTESKWQLFKCLTFPICLGTLGCFPYAGTPPLFKGPMDIWMKAYFLSKYYGSPEQISFVAEHKNQKVTPALQEISDKLSTQIEDLYQRKGQETKLLALLKIYFELGKLNLSDPKSIDHIMQLMDSNLEIFAGFSSGFGKIKAGMVQFFKDTSYCETMSETRILIGKLKNVIEREAYPEDQRYRRTM